MAMVSFQSLHFHLKLGTSGFGKRFSFFRKLVLKLEYWIQSKSRDISQSIKRRAILKIPHTVLLKECKDFLYAST